MAYNMPEGCGECPTCGLPYFNYPNCTCITNEILEEFKLEEREDECETCGGYAGYGMRYCSSQCAGFTQEEINKVIKGEER